MHAPFFGLLFFLLLPMAPLQTGSYEHVSPVEAARIETRIELDGRLTDEAWLRADAVTRFVQRDPDEGSPATEATELRVLFDDRALYVGARLFDREPHRIVDRLARRDTFSDADRFTIYLDPHHDHLTGAMFEISAGNVQRDAVISNDTSQDQSWDGVWESAVSTDETGWSVEMRIPFSQLRFPPLVRHTWGINASRYIHRKNETDWLELVPKNENGLASRMVHLNGIEGIDEANNLEIVPYTVIRTDFVAPPSPLDPLNDGSRISASGGVDIKYGLSSSFTLSATINPDFGQVEVDPAVVNLSAFETFFQEKRPFFLEGVQMFGNFGRGGANNFFNFGPMPPNLFYSRRIGRQPQGRASGEFVERPEATTILGAAKLTGRTAGGWSFGLLEAVTGREYARVANGNNHGSAEIEPLTNYFVARVQRELGHRGGFGFLTTGTQRDLRMPELRSLLPRRAVVMGGDAYVFFDDRREWVINGYFARSSVTGSPSAIERLQRAPQRYYQRPDAAHVRVDPTRTALSGWSGRVNLNRNGGKLWSVNASLWGISPGFETNDLGLHFSGDAWGGHAVFLLRKLNPDRWTRQRNMWFAKHRTYNFNGEKTGDGFFMSGAAEFLNYWNISGGGGYNPRMLDDDRTRGGPIAIQPANTFMNFNLNTDGRKSVSLSAGFGYNSNEFGGWGGNTFLTLNLKPSSSLTISTGPNYNRSRSVAQYVAAMADTTAKATFGTRYIFSDLDQTSVSLITRANWVLTPKLSLQVYAQPLISVGDYQAVKEFEQPGTFSFRRYGENGSTLQYSAARRQYAIDPDGEGPAAPFTLGDSDFNFKSLRVNAVFRWEWRLGSTLFVAWTQNRVDLSNPGQLSLGRDVQGLFRGRADNVFLVKLAYWFGR